MSLKIALQQITVPSFWHSLPASQPIQIDKDAGAARRKMVLDVLATQSKPVSTDAIVDLVFDLDETVTRNSVANALQRLNADGRITKEVSFLRPGHRVAFWRIS